MSAYDDAKREPSAFVAALIANSEPPAVTVPFPRNGRDGKPLAHLQIRLLTQAEEDLCFANARRYVAQLTEGEGDIKWKPEELEHNARASEILAVACRKADDATKPFFEHGVVDTRQFVTDELGQLMLVYARVKEDRWPALNSMSADEFNKWVDIVAEGAVDYPFSFFSRTKLETFCDLLATSLVDARALFATGSSFSTSGASAPGVA